MFLPLRERLGIRIDVVLASGGVSFFCAGPAKLPPLVRKRVVSSSSVVGSSMPLLQAAQRRQSIDLEVGWARLGVEGVGRDGRQTKRNKKWASRGEKDKSRS